MDRDSSEELRVTWAEKISKFTPTINLSPTALYLFTNTMFIIALLACIPLFTQCYTVYKSGDATGISIFAFSFQMFISASWFVYALIARNGIIVISSSLVFIAAGLLVFLTLRSRRK